MTKKGSGREIISYGQSDSLPEARLDKQSYLALQALQSHGFDVFIDLEDRRVEIGPPEGDEISDRQVEALFRIFVDKAGFATQIAQNFRITRRGIPIEGEVTGSHRGGIGRLTPGQRRIGSGRSRDRGRNRG